MNNQLMEKMFLMPALAFGSGPCLGDLVQEFGWITWPLCSEFFFFTQRINNIEFMDLAATPNGNPNRVVLKQCRKHDAVLRATAVCHKAQV